MSLWTERILGEFPPDVTHLWIASDPDDALLDEKVLSGLRERGFAVLPFEDSVAFRAEYEECYRVPWEEGSPAPAKAVILHLRDSNVDELPWDYLRTSRQVSLGLNDLFPKLSYGVVRQIDSELLPALFDTQEQHCTQAHGEAATKDFVLTHIFQFSPHLMNREEDFWREVLRLHYRDTALPKVLAEHVTQIISDKKAFKNLPITELLEQKDLTLRTVQDAWSRYLHELGLSGARTGESQQPSFVPEIVIPFEHHDIRVIVDSMFLDGTLHPLAVQGVPHNLPEWAKAGVIQDPGTMRDLIRDGIKSLSEESPDGESSYRDWLHFARRVGEILSRFNGLDPARADSVRADIESFVKETDKHLAHWIARHYADLPSLPITKGPVMLHHVPRYLAMNHPPSDEKIALVVFDGMAIDQWVQIRESLVKACDTLIFNELSCFAWLPTLTSVSRQSLFSGLRPREFPDHIESTSREPSHWTRFWQDNGVHQNEIFFRKSIKRNDDLPELQEALSNPRIKVAGLVVDTIDEIIHGAVLGKQGVATQIANWCESGFIKKLLTTLLDNGYQVYLTADHGNAEATGIGHIKQGVTADVRGQRVRTYRNENTIAETEAENPDTFRVDVPGLPADFMPLFAHGRGAFAPKGEQVVAHGGMSLEELIVPFVKVSSIN